MKWSEVDISLKAMWNSKKGEVEGRFNSYDKVESDDLHIFSNLECLI
jgi:hypothetical protein